MNQKIKRIIYGVIGTILMVLDFVTLYIYYSNYTRKNDPFEIKDKIKEYMAKHNLKEEDYNFEKVFWNPNKDVPFLLKLILLYIFTILNIAYLIIGVLGFIFYMCGLPHPRMCPFVTSIIIYSHQIVIGIIDISVAFAHSTLKEKDLTDFGELNDIINKTYDLYLEGKLNMKLSGFYLLFSPFFFIVTSFIEICTMNKNKNIVVQPMAQPMMQITMQPIFQPITQPVIQPGIQPINQYNLNTNEPLMVKQENNLYNQPNDGINNNTENNN